MSKSLEKALRAAFGKIKSAKGNWIRIPCPTCDPHDARKMKRYVSTTSDYSKCFICEIPLTTSSELLNKDIKFERVQVEEEPKKEHTWARVLPGHNFIPVNQLPLDHPAIKFLHKDFLFDLDSYYQQNGIVYCPSDSGIVLYTKPFTTSAERLIFPVKFNGQLVGWQMRSIPGTFYGDQQDVIRYLHLFDKGSYLFNFDNARKYGMVVVTEGAKKALKFPNGVATLGKGVSEEQIQLLQIWKRITIMLDGEDHNNTQEQALELTNRIRQNGREAINIDLRKYNYISPDEVPSDMLATIVYKEWKDYDTLHNIRRASKVLS